MEVKTKKKRIKRQTVTVGKDEGFQFQTIGEALLFAEGNSLVRPRILIADGVYREKLFIKIEGLVLEGQGSNKTTIVFDDNAKKLHLDGTEYITFQTGTVTILSDFVTIRNLTIENDAGDGKQVGQAVALLNYGDSSFLDKCVLKAKQDTLFLAPLPFDLRERYKNVLSLSELSVTKQCYQVYYRCKVEGDVDFIFGGAEAVFYDCEIFSHKKEGNSFVTAPSTDESNKNGMSFIKCKFTSNAEKGSVYLARPWRHFAKADFFDCEIGEHINDAGFCEWEGMADRHLNSRFSFMNLKRDGREFLPSFTFSINIDGSERAEVLDKLSIFLKNL